MTEYEFLLSDRIAKIKSVISKYGEENFSISYSGGKDSNVLSALIDIAIPNNKIPRVYADTGIELNMIRDFVYSKASSDTRFIIIKPKTAIKNMLDNDGYPFKSKQHSKLVSIYQKYRSLEGRTGLQHYLGICNDGHKWGYKYSCPKTLKYQFTEDFNLKISDKCCKRLKEEPLENWKKENNKSISIIGLMRAEGGRRQKAQCLAFNNNKLSAFQPLVVLNKEWEDWFIEKYKVVIPALYYQPYNFDRTGCKGCPFAQDLQHELDVLEKFFPNERRQCEIIWEPVYSEYRRIGYKLKDEYRH